METTTTEKQTMLECLITLVTPGHSDRLIKIFPAEHKEEKIWLDNTPGKERWEMIQRSIQLHASRFSPIPEPKPWHGDPLDLKAVTLKKEDIPLVKLEDFVLPAPPMEKPTDSPTEPELTVKQWDERFNRLETLVGKLADAVLSKPQSKSPLETLKTEVEAPDIATETAAREEKRARGRPRKIV